MGPSIVLGSTRPLRPRPWLKGGAPCAAPCPPHTTSDHRGKQRSPCQGGAGEAPSASSRPAPSLPFGTHSTASFSTCWRASWQSRWLMSCRSTGSGAVGCGQRLGLRLIDADGLVQARQVKDVPVMVAQAKGEEALLLAFHADQQRDQQTDAPAVHVLHRTEVQDNGAGTGRGCLRVGIHEHIFS